MSLDLGWSQSISIWVVSLWNCLFVFFQIEEVHQTWMICFNIFRATQCTCCMLKSYLLQVLASLKQTSKWPWKWRPPGSLEIPSFEKPPFLRATVDGRNPAPLVMYETSQIMGHLPFQLVQDFLHQPYVRIFVSVVIGVYLLELPETPATNFRAARIDPVQQWPQRLSFDSLSFGDRFGPDSESVLCLREDFWKDCKTRKFQHLKSFGDELKALFLGWLVAFSQAPLSNLTGLKVGRIILPNCLPRDSALRKANKPSVEIPEHRQMRLDTGKTADFCWAMLSWQGGPQFSTL